MWDSLIFVVLIVIVLYNALVVLASVSANQLSEARLKKLASDGNHRAKRLLKLELGTARFSYRIRTVTTLLGMFFITIVTVTYSSDFANNLFINSSSELFTNRELTYVFCSFVGTLIFSTFYLAFGIALPQKIALQRVEPSALKLSKILIITCTLIKPFASFTRGLGKLFVRLFGFDPNANVSQVTEEEIRLMVEDAGERGAILESQREIIDNLFEFDDITVGDVMTHRTDIVALDSEGSLQLAIDLAIEEGFSRIPVYEEDLDNIIGVIYVKDLLRFVGHEIPQESDLTTIMREAYHVPISKSCLELFKEMTENRTQMAIVIDEYGGTAGIVSMEDLIESILGNIQDEYDDEEQEIEKLNETTFTIDGVCEIEEVEEMLNIKMPDGEFDTIGGFILTKLGRYPQKDEMPVVEYENYRFTVINFDERRIEKILAEQIAPLQKEEAIDE